MKTVVSRYNHAEVAFCVYFKCEWPLSAVPQPFLMFHLASGSVEDGWLFLNVSSVPFCSLLVILLLLVRHQSLKLRPVSPCYLNVSSENLFTEVGIVSIITYSSVCLQTGLSSLQSFSEGPCFQALMLHHTSVHLASLQDGNCFLLHISVTGDLWIT